MKVQEEYEGNKKREKKKKKKKKKMTMADEHLCSSLTNEFRGT